MIVERLLRVALLGSSWVLYLLLGLSVISLGAIVERLRYFRRASGGEALRAALATRLGDDDLEGARAVLAASESVESRVLRAALPWRRGGAEAFLDALDSESASARGELERGLNTLGTLGNNAPFVGLFGTVIGVIEAFNHLGGATARGGNMTQVMAGIAEALVATAVGIFVALPAVVAYNSFQKRIGELESNIVGIGRLFSAYLRAQRSAASEEPAPAERKGARGNGAARKGSAEATALSLAAEGA